MPAQDKGYIHIYTGDGKGKTTASVGLTIRAAARKWRVLFVQFLKSGKSAELEVLRSFPNVEVVSGQKVAKFTFAMTPEELATAKQEMSERLDEAIRRAEEVDLLVLDEALGAISAGVISEEKLLTFMREKPVHLELVLTGRNPSDELVEQSDYCSEVRMRKHPYENEQLQGRPGVEF